VESRPCPVRASDGSSARHGRRNLASLNGALYTRFGNHHRRQRRGRSHRPDYRTRSPSRRTTRRHSITFCARRWKKRQRWPKSSCQFHQREDTRGAGAASGTTYSRRRCASSLCLRPSTARPRAPRRAKRRPSPARRLRLRSATGLKRRPSPTRRLPARSATELKRRFGVKQTTRMPSPATRLPP
jgi:hypothetical protein